MTGCTCRLSVRSAVVTGCSDEELSAGGISETATRDWAFAAKREEDAWGVLRNDCCWSVFNFWKEIYGSKYS
jgi:hypothetical protein